jgi:hypothetical protein
VALVAAGADARPIVARSRRWWSPGAATSKGYQQ